MGIEAGEHLQQRGPVGAALTEADDAAAAELDARRAHPLQGFEALLVGAGADDLPVVLGAGVEVVVVGGEARVGQPGRLGSGEHAGGHAGLQPQLAHAPHHLQHRLKGGAVANVAPGPAHAEAVGTGITGSPGPRQHRLHLQLRTPRDIAAVVHGLGAIGAVLLTAAGLDAQQGGQLHPVARVGGPVHLLGLPEQVHQRQIQQGLDFRLAPIVARDHGGVSTPPKRRWRPW